MILYSLLRALRPLSYSLVKILFDHPNPFLLAHGGFQTQIEQTKLSLEEIGIEVEYLRWWDDHQHGDLIHYFGRPTGSYLDFAHQKGIKVIVAELHTGLGSRSNTARFVQKKIITLSQRLLPSSFTAKLSWDAYRQADAFIALTSWEASLMHTMFDADPSRIHVVPNGVEAAFFKTESILDSLETSPGIPTDNPHSQVPPKGNALLEQSARTTANSNHFLVCTATITSRKRVVELCQAAIEAQAPLWIIGKPYSEADPYYLAFLELQQQNAALIRFEGGISDRTKLAQIYRESRGFVLLSAMESLSLSALEAAASGCPLLLSKLPWATSTFGTEASYCKIAAREETARCLRSFYDQSPSLPKTFKPLTWLEVAEQIKRVYEQVLSGK